VLRRRIKYTEARSRVHCGVVVVVCVSVWRAEVAALHLERTKTDVRLRTFKCVPLLVRRASHRTVKGAAQGKGRASWRKLSHSDKRNGENCTMRSFIICTLHRMLT
jgi:hypothetical protein